jgi:alcohol oxidase
MADVKTLTWGYKFSREIARRMPYFRGEPAARHPAFAPGSAAAIIPHAEGHIAFDTPRIEYSEEDERALETFARATSACNLEHVSTKMVSDGSTLPLE